MNLLQTILESVENSNHAGSRQDLHGFLNVAEMLPVPPKAFGVRPGKLLSKRLAMSRSRETGQRYGRVTLPRDRAASW